LGYFLLESGVALYMYTVFASIYWFFSSFCNIADFFLVDLTDHRLWFSFSLLFGFILGICRRSEPFSFLLQSPVARTHTIISGGYYRLF